MECEARDCKELEAEREDMMINHGFVSNSSTPAGTVCTSTLDGNLGRQWHQMFPVHRVSPHVPASPQAATNGSDLSSLATVAQYHAQ
jgi:hypothetical protein